MNTIPEKPYQGDARIMMLDVESTNLSADFGFTLCVCTKVVGEDVKVFRIDRTKSFRSDPTNDKELLRRVSKEVASADLMCWHYGDRFDRRFINTRLLYHNLPPLTPVKSIDTWRIARDHLALTSNRLAAITELLDLPRKTPLSRRAWIRASAGHKPSIDIIVKHCIADIVALEATYLRLRCLCGKHPNVAIFLTSQDGKTRCPVCGSIHVQKRGYAVAMSRISQRYQCQNCGAWGFGKPEKPGLQREIVMRKCV